jgi:transposase
MNKITESKQGQVMLQQHIIADQTDGPVSQRKGIIVPLDLPELEIMSQSLQADGSIEVHIRAIKEREACPRCGKICVKIHDMRERVKKDLAMGNHQVRLVFSKRRFRCLACKGTFTQTDSSCGRYKRTTKRLRDALASQAEKCPIAHVAQEAGVGPRFVEECLEGSVQELMAKQGRTLEETSPFPTPRFLGIDEFARRKGHQYDTILCDLVNRTVLEVSEGRKLEDIQKLLERLSTPYAVEAVSMDMSASFRPAVQLCLRNLHKLWSIISMWFSM